MAGKWRTMGGILAVAFGVMAMPVEAQRGFGRGGRGLVDPAGPNMGRNLELALEKKDELQLTGEQVAQLQELKAIVDSDVAGLAEEMTSLREALRAGDVARDDGWRQMEALRGEMIAASAPLRGRVQEILTVEQHNKLQPLVRQGRTGLGRGGAPGARAFERSGARGARMPVGRGRGMGMQANPRGIRGGIATRPGWNRQGRAPALGSRGTVRGFGSGRGIRPAFNGRRGIGGQVDPGAISGGTFPRLISYIE